MIPLGSLVCMAGCRRVVMQIDPVPVPPSCHRVNPTRIVQVPRNSLAEPARKAFQRHPSDFRLDLGRIYRISAIVTKPILYETDLRFIMPARAQLRKDLAKFAYDLNVCLLTVTSNIVRFSHTTFAKYLPYRFTMVDDKKPVTNILTITVDRKRLPIYCVQDHERYQLLGKLAGSVVIRAIGRKHRETIRMPERPNEMVGGSFGRGIRTVRSICCGFGESMFFWSKRPI